MHNLVGDLVGIEGGLDRMYKALLVCVVQLDPARHKCGIEQLERQRVVYFREAPARTQRVRRRLTQHFHRDAPEPLAPVLGGRDT